MADRLFVAVLGRQRAGKSWTWNRLFALPHDVKTQSKPRNLQVAPGECVEVFLVSGSNEERKQYAGDVLDNQKARIVLCSVQYVKGQTTLEYAKDNNFDLYVQWINPGHSDAETYFDYLGLMPVLTSEKATFSLRNGKVSSVQRVQEIREFIYGWAKSRDLIFPCSGSS